MRLKTGVSIKNISPQMVIACMVAKDLYDTLDQEFVITSGCDGNHIQDSLHYVGKAVDIRTREFPTEGQCKAVANEIGVRLGKEFDVIYHKNHIHIEYDPKA